MGTEAAPPLLANWLLDDHLLQTVCLRWPQLVQSANTAPNGLTSRLRPSYRPPEGPPASVDSSLSLLRQGRRLDREEVLEAAEASRLPSADAERRAEGHDRQRGLRQRVGRRGGLDATSAGGEHPPELAG